jgi:signal transduction histidine kinase
MRLGRPWSWGVSARSALVAATVVFVALTAAGAILAAVLYRSMLSGIDSTAAARVSEVAANLESHGAAGLDPGLLGTDQRILAVQVLTADGTVVRRSPSAPETPLMPISEIGDGLHIGMPEHSSPYGQIRFSAQSVDGPGGRYTVLVGEGSQVVFSTVKTVVIALALAAPIVVAVSAAATYMLVRRSMRSVDEIRSRVSEISTSDLTERVPVPEKRDEISALALTMNEMLARIEAGHSAQQRFVGDASHELRSPLTTIISALEVAVAHPELLNGELAKTTLIPEAHRMQALVDDLLLLARADERGLTMAHDDVDLDDLVATEAEKLRRETALNVYTDVMPTRVVGDSVRLSRALRNLLDNAARHATAEVSVTARACGDRAVVTVDDDGPGIPPADRERVFGRFVRLDANRSRSAGGAGLGLAIVREIVVAHHGSVAITDRPGDGGTRISVQLPLAYAPDSRR